MSMTIKTDHRWKKFYYRNEVPEKVLEAHFSHLEEAYDGFFCYRRRWYHVSDFMSVRETLLNSLGFDGVLSDSFFSGVLLKLSSDGEEYQAATFFS